MRLCTPASKLFTVTRNDRDARAALTAARPNFQNVFAAPRACAEGGANILVRSFVPSRCACARRPASYSLLRATTGTRVLRSPLRDLISRTFLPPPEPARKVVQIYWCGLSFLRDALVHAGQQAIHCYAQRPGRACCAHRCAT